MSISRYLATLATLLAGFVLVAFALLDGAGLGWLTLGLSALATGLGLIAFPLPARTGWQRAINVVVIVVGGWTIVASRTESGAALRWLAFSGGAAIAGLALIALVVTQVLAVRDIAFA